MLPDFLMVPAVVFLFATFTWVLSALFRSHEVGRLVMLLSGFMAATSAVVSAWTLLAIVAQ